MKRQKEKPQVAWLPAEPIWLSAREVAELEGISWNHIKRRCKKGYYKDVKWVLGNGGKQYRILLSNLSKAGQISYRIGVTGKSNVRKNAIIDEKYRRAPLWNKRKADKYLSILKAAGSLKGSDLQKFVVGWNKTYPKKHTSYVRILDARKIYKRDGVSGLMAKYYGPFAKKPAFHMKVENKNVFFSLTPDRASMLFSILIDKIVSQKKA
jgi:hypothetical protein